MDDSSLRRQLTIGDWLLAIGDFGLPQVQSQIANSQSPIINVLARPTFANLPPFG
jgi:hypothetical protein